MRIQINEDPYIQDVEIIINCKKITDVENILAYIRVLDLKLTGKKDNEIYVLDAEQLLYIDTVDKKTFFYTKSEVYETELKLYELEEQLATLDFIRVSKSCILNLNQIIAIKADIDGKLLITMSNREKLFASRQYSPLIKKKLGVK